MIGASVRVCAKDPNICGNHASNGLRSLRLRNRDAQRLLVPYHHLRAPIRDQFVAVGSGVMVGAGQFC